MFLSKEQIIPEILVLEVISHITIGIFLEELKISH